MKLLLLCGPVSSKAEPVSTGAAYPEHMWAPCMYIHTETDQTDTQSTYTSADSTRRPHPAPLACREGLGPLVGPVHVRMEDMHPVDGWGHQVAGIRAYVAGRATALCQLLMLTMSLAQVHTQTCRELTKTRPVLLLTSLCSCPWRHTGSLLLRSGCHPSAPGS